MTIGMSIVNFFVACSIMITGFFGGLGNTLFPWDEPEQTITEPAKVVALYKEIAAQNEETSFRERFSYDRLLAGQDSRLSWFIEGWARVAMFVINPNFSYRVWGVPGEPQKLKASDLKSAKAEYYKGGKTVVITMDIKDQTDYFEGKSSGQSVSRALRNSSDRTYRSIPEQLARIDQTVESIEVRYENARVEIRADVATGKIVAAKFTYYQTVTAVPNETDVPFSQTFNYLMQRP